MSLRESRPFYPHGQVRSVTLIVSLTEMADLGQREAENSVLGHNGVQAAKVLPSKKSMTSSSILGPRNLIVSKVSLCSSRISWSLNRFSSYLMSLRHTPARCVP